MKKLFIIFFVLLIIFIYLLQRKRYVGGNPAHFPNMIHIAGTSGSGKTYLYYKYKKKINIFDLDIIRINKPKKGELYEKYMIKQLKKLPKNSIVVGYLGHFYNDELIFPNITFGKSYYIDIPFEKLLKQIHKRDLEYQKQNPNIKIKPGYYNIHLDPHKTKKEVKKMYDYDKKLYINKSYKLITTNKLEDIIKKL